MIDQTIGQFILPDRETLTAHPRTTQEHRGTIAQGKGKSAGNNSQASPTTLRILTVWVPEGPGSEESSLCRADLLERIKQEYTSPPSVVGTAAVTSGVEDKAAVKVDASKYRIPEVDLSVDIGVGKLIFSTTSAATAPSGEDEESTHKGTKDGQAAVASSDTCCTPFWESGLYRGRLHVRVNPKTAMATGTFQFEMTKAHLRPRPMLGRSATSVPPLECKFGPVTVRFSCPLKDPSLIQFGDSASTHVDVGPYRIGLEKEKFLPLALTNRLIFCSNEYILGSNSRFMETQQLLSQNFFASDSPLPSSSSSTTIGASADNYGGNFVVATPEGHMILEIDAAIQHFQEQAVNEEATAPRESITSWTIPVSNKEDEEDKEDEESGKVQDEGEGEDSAEKQTGTPSPNSKPQFWQSMFGSKTSPKTRAAAEEPGNATDDVTATVAESSDHESSGPDWLYEKKRLQGKISDMIQRYTYHNNDPEGEEPPQWQQERAALLRAAKALGELERQAESGGSVSGS